MTIEHLTIIEISAYLILFYALSYTYWIKYILFRPFVPLITGESNRAESSRKRWARISAYPIKPFDCFSCSLLWIAAVTSYNLGHTLHDYLYHVALTYLSAVLIQKHIES